LTHRANRVLCRSIDRGERETHTKRQSSLDVQDVHQDLVQDGFGKGLTRANLFGLGVTVFRENISAVGAMPFAREGMVTIFPVRGGIRFADGFGGDADSPEGCDCQQLDELNEREDGVLANLLRPANEGRVILRRFVTPVRPALKLPVAGRGTLCNWRRMRCRITRFDSETV